MRGKLKLLPQGGRVTRSRLLATCLLFNNDVDCQGHRTYISLIPRVLYLYCFVRGNGYQRVDVLGSRKWQESIHRLNGEAPGISGLMSFSEVRGIHPLRFFSLTERIPLTRHGQF